MTVDEDMFVKAHFVTDHCTLTAISSGVWTSADTWDDTCPESTPANSTDAHIPNGYVVTYDAGNTTVEGLTVGGGDGKLQFPDGGTLTVSGDILVNDGVLDLGAVGDLVVGGSLTNQGKVIQTKNVEVTESTESTVSFLDYGGYGGLTITANTQSLGPTTVEIVGGQPCDTNDSAVHRCFSIDPTNSTTAADVTFYFATSELNGSDCSSIQAWRWYS